MQLLPHLTVRTIMKSAICNPLNIIEASVLEQSYQTQYVHCLKISAKLGAPRFWPSLLNGQIGLNISGSNFTDLAVK